MSTKEGLSVVDVSSVVLEERIIDLIPFGRDNAIHFPALAVLAWGRTDISGKRAREFVKRCQALGVRRRAPSGELCLISSDWRGVYFGNREDVRRSTISRIRRGARIISGSRKIIENSFPDLVHVPIFDGIDRLLEVRAEDYRLLPAGEDDTMDLFESEEGR